MDNSPSFLRRLLGIPLGLFVLGQVLFLLSSNLLRMEEDAKPYVKKALKQTEAVQMVAPDWLRIDPERLKAASEWLDDEKSDVQAAMTYTQRATKRWAELTGQPQSWSLFAPHVFEHIPFPRLELRWDDERMPAQSAASTVGCLTALSPLEAATAWAAANHVTTAVHPPEILNSVNEPEDRHRYFRFGRFRLRRYEGNVVVILAARDEPREAMLDHWRGKIEAQLRGEGEQMHAYVRWRVTAFLRDHPDLPPPTQAILKMRLYRIPPPPGPDPWDWQCSEEPIARWRPGAEPGKGYFALEMYNPVLDQFEKVWKPD